MTYQTIAMDVQGEMGYTFSIERGTVLLRGQEAPVEIALRVTHIFRRENGEWKLLHYHADPLMDKKTLASGAGP